MLNLILHAKIFEICLFDLNLVPFDPLETPQINWHDSFPRLLIPLRSTIFRIVLRRDGKLANVDADAADGAELAGLHGAAEDVGSCGGSRLDGYLGGEGVGEDYAVLEIVIC